MMTHGGNIYRLAGTLRIPERKVVDFSTSVNPLGISKKIRDELRRHLKYLNNYPDPACHRLRWHISKHLSVPEENISCGNGSTELIYLVVRTLKPERVLIPAPTFSEYERAVITSGDSHGGKIRFLPLKEEDNFRVNVKGFMESMEGCQMAFLCNPNNPTAQLLPKKDLIEIASAAREMRCFLVLDEAFIDFIPDETAVDLVLENPYLIVLRSMTKFYALSGLRLGYGIFPSEVAEKLKAFKEPWTVNTLAQRAGVIALKDRAYIRATFEYIGKEKDLIEKGLTGLGIRFYPSKTNFYLLKHERAEEILLSLRKKGMLLRDCSNFRGIDRGFFRIAVKSHRDNALLIKELKRILY